MRLESQTGLISETSEAWVVLVGVFVKTLCEQVLTVVVLTLVAVRLVAVAGIEALGQKQQTANAVAVLSEVGRVAELILMTLRVVPCTCEAATSSTAAVAILLVP